ncbi:hypothetical protein B0O99DRAFT_692966 [Bisporella sp. PMI_857]|nr:hypothetical protein B0O99DRAFT_692966 [Bisporella sp. PMI_857]
MRPVTKIAKSTIDTGSMQGNIVSRTFVENVLEFPASSFAKLTKDEETHGIGITGDPHIPLGAIYLTLYRNNSTRVFQDMRFLVSPTPNCDLVVGALSIWKDRIFDIPCLMNLNGSSDYADHSIKASEKQILRILKSRLENEYNILDWAFQVYGITFGKLPDKEKRSKADPLWEKVGLNYLDISWKLHPQKYDIMEKLKSVFECKEIFYPDVSGEPKLESDLDYEVEGRTHKT